MKTGDVIFIKSHPPSEGLILKAVGIVTNADVRNRSNLGDGVEVHWTWKGNERLGQISDKYNVRNITLYEEFNPTVQSKVLELLLSNSPAKSVRRQKKNRK